MYVNTESGLKIREYAGIDQRVLCVAKYGTSIEVLKENRLSGWHKVKLDDITGYACADYLQDNDPIPEHELLGKFKITAYTHTGYACANGNMPTAGYTIACNSLDFGTEVYIDGVGYRTVEDRGPDSMGSEWLDLFMSTNEECMQWGCQFRNVFVVNKEEDKN